ncbi:hypothetical protein, partial [uncultured Paenibacillus sp.]|uniref:hypothetical protein n=1 Tax=uncultured Paenibacillus sp. TaxID=227322 RepID=UPI0028D06FAA
IKLSIKVEPLVERAWSAHYLYCFSVIPCGMTRQFRSLFSFQRTMEFLFGASRERKTSFLSFIAASQRRLD